MELPSLQGASLPVFAHPHLAKLAGAGTGGAGAGKLVKAEPAHNECWVELVQGSLRALNSQG